LQAHLAFQAKLAQIHSAAPAHEPVPNTEVLMKRKLPAIAVFVFILVVMFFLFPRGCPQTVSPAATSPSAAP